MLRRDIADRLQILICKRFREEYPEHQLTQDEINNIWFTIYGKLCRGKTEKEVEEWCKTVDLYVKKIHRPIRCGY